MHNHDNHGKFLASIAQKAIHVSCSECMYVCMTNYHMITIFWYQIFLL